MLRALRGIRGKQRPLWPVAPCGEAYLLPYEEMIHSTGSNSSSQVETKAFCCLLRSGELFRDSAKMNFKIIVKLSWCQSGATRREGFGKLHI